MPVLLSVSLAENKRSSQCETWLFVGKFVAGRVVVYVLLGVLSGFIGASMGHLSHRLVAYAWVFLSVTLIAYGLGLKLPRFGACNMFHGRSGNKFFPFLLGGLTGVNICPPILLMVTYALEQSVSPLSGIIIFISFFLATTIFMLPAGFTGYLKRFANLPSLGRLATAVIGIVFLYQGISLLGWVR
jgi:sulfite exporter TauE/SafE